MIQNPNHGDTIQTSVYNTNGDQSENENAIENERGSTRKFQSHMQSATIMCNNYPEIVVVESQNTQGEGKIPSNLMREKHWDIKVFPSFHLTGTFGLYHPREIKLTP